MADCVVRWAIYACHRAPCARVAIISPRRPTGKAVLKKHVLKEVEFSPRMLSARAKPSQIKPRQVQNKQDQTRLVAAQDVDRENAADHDGDWYQGHISTTPSRRASRRASG